MRLRPLLAILPLLLAACVAMKPAPNFATLSIGIHTVEGQGAARTLDAEGRVEGSHLSGNRSAPMVAMSTEQARPEDLREIAKLVRRLPVAAPLTEELRKAPHVELEVRLSDGTTVTYAHPSDQSFADATLRRLEQIIISYRAGYW